MLFWLPIRSLLITAVCITMFTACAPSPTDTGTTPNIIDDAGGTTPDGGGDAGNDTTNGGGNNTGNADSNTDTQLEITNTTPENYRWDTLQNGKTTYIDRDYRYQNTPEAYQGLAILRTANNDRAATDTAFITFDVNQSVTVYVARDSRHDSAPTWLDTWVETTDELSTDDTTFALYSKTYNAGTVRLGGNSASQFSMYAVLVDSSTSGNNGNPPPPSPEDSAGGNNGGNTNNNTATPNATDDTSTTAINTATTIDVLTNDIGLQDGPIVASIFSSPSNGSASVQSNNTIRYTPTTDFAGTDSFVYKIVDIDGDIATATVDVTVDCVNCAVSTTIALTWDKNINTILGYEVYFAKSSSATDATYLIDTVAITSEGFDASAPSVEYDAWNDLGLNKNDSVCFRIKAYNSTGSSDYSEAQCSTI